MARHIRVKGGDFDQRCTLGRYSRAGLQRRKSSGGNFCGAPESDEPGTGDIGRGDVVVWLRVPHLRAELCPPCVVGLEAALAAKVAQ